MTKQIHELLAEIYGAEQASSTYQQIEQMIASAQKHPLRSPQEDLFSEQDIILITYGDSLQEQGGETPLASLRKFARQYLQNRFSAIHILPFFPYSSDDGFSVQDFYAVNPQLGTWEDIEKLGKDFELMFDAVFNHMSAQSNWFRAFLADNPEFIGLFRVENPSVDLSAVTRPRTSPLLTPFEKDNGETVHVWTTFSADQVDFDVSWPEALLRLLAILLFYVEKGAKFIRLDAIAYLWKEAGTSSIHLPQTHAIIQLMRSVLDEVAPSTLLITETNVPHVENISYFGDGYNEAQLVYNFTLPPLLFHTLLSQDSTKLTEWANTLQLPSEHTAFFNFTASHDGIGVRPVEGILDKSEIDALLSQVEKQGGRVSYKNNADGTRSPYELNITYLDTLATPTEDMAIQVNRFMVSQAIMLALAGVPAVYIHSLLGSKNNISGMLETGQNRTINRAKLSLETIEAEVSDKKHLRHHVFGRYLRLIEIRRQNKAFHPNAAQKAVFLGKGIFAVWRESLDEQERILALHSVSPTLQAVDLANLGISRALELIEGQEIVGPTFELTPYQVAWLLV